MAWLVLFATGFWVLGGLLWQLTGACRSRGWTGRATGVIVRRGHEDLQFPGRRLERRSFRMSVVEIFEYGSIPVALAVAGLFIGFGIAVLLDVFG